MVAKEGSIKLAAEKLHISQPTISDQIKLLEEHFQCSLFERRNRALFLTKEGEVALHYAQKIFDLSKEATFRLKNKLKIPKKSLDIGITHFSGHYFNYERVLELIKETDFTINFRTDERHKLLADLEDEQLDMVFTVNKEAISTNIDTFRIGLNKNFAVCHKSIIPKKLEFPDCLSQIPYFSYPLDSYLKYEIDLFFTKNGLAPKIIGHAEDMDVFKLVTTKALGFTILPESIKNKVCLDKNIKVLGELKELQTPLYGVIKHGQNNIARSFLEKLIS